MHATSSPADPAPHGAPAAVASHGGKAPGRLQWVALYLQSVLDERRVSASTLEAYTRDLALLSRWVAAQDLDLEQVSPDDLARYVRQRSAQGIHLSTLARHLSSFRRFYSFLVRHGVRADNPAAPVAVSPPVTLPTAPLRDDALRALLQPSRRRQPSPAAAFRAQRDHMLVCMLYATSLGVSAVRLLCWAQFDEHWQVVRAPRRNGGARSHPLDPRLVPGLKALRAALDTPGVDLPDCEYCFPTSVGLPMTRQSLCHLVRKWAGDCGQAQPVTPSVLRKTGQARLPRLRR